VAALVALVIAIMVIRRLRFTPATAPAEPAGRTGVMADVVSLSEQNPEMMARLISRWLEDQESPTSRAAA
jgi:hypothetical protein